MRTTRRTAFLKRDVGAEVCTRTSKTRRGAMSDVQWVRDVDAAMTQARAKNIPLLLDFNAAPM